MDCDFVCEVLHYLLAERFGTQLIKLSIDLPDVDNMATLDLLCVLFKHRECYKYLLYCILKYLEIGNKR